MPRNDVAIYTPGTSQLYEADEQRARTGGAELQTKILAQFLAERGRRVAHIVFCLRSKPPTLPAGLTLVQREDLRGRPGRRQKLFEVERVWRSLREADARLYLFRGGNVQLVVGAAFCRLRRRRLVFSAANDLDFLFDREDRSRWFSLLYRAALRRAAVVVVQTEAQLELAVAAGISRCDVVLIRSFAEPAAMSMSAPQAFLWAGRLVDYKQPLEYLRLAAALPEIEFVMVAAPTNETSAAVARAVEEADSELPNLTVRGALPREEVLELVERATAIVSTSSHEGMPNVFLEGWARGIPTVSLDFDPDGLIRGFGLGVACEGRWEEFVVAIERLAGDRELRAEMAARARRYVIETHSLETVGDRWANLVAEQLDEGGTLRLSAPTSAGG